VGDVLEPMGCLSPPEGVPCIVDHVPKIENIVGRAYVKPQPDAVVALIQFLDEGVSEKADLAYNIFKSGAGNQVSVGFDPIEREPLSSGGWRFKSWRILELSLVCCAANQDAIVVERDFRRAARERPMSQSELEAEAVRMQAEINRLDQRILSRAGEISSAHYCAEAREQAERDILARSALLYERDPIVQRDARERELKKLGGLIGR
jgi:hypothetical protein